MAKLMPRRRSPVLPDSQMHQKPVIQMTGGNSDERFNGFSTCIMRERNPLSSFSAYEESLAASDGRSV
ncbi:Hypothetical predicted protein [Podarcis lilfordi]|uniref:Uncharacterized protein n=1 Tax=Podarcis lilfordi TaxID=74358 RepID=A0AA35JU29_9SAUR|nr:Hypothetical predicted protein [Podarcis lilfordi]